MIFLNAPVLIALRIGVGTTIKLSDKLIEKGLCGKERPDIVYETSTKIIIIECDEHQHKNITCECEQARMINICQSLGGIPTYFIRWNPDAYESESKRIESVSDRQKTLADYIDCVFKEKIALPENLLSVCYMYYDGWSNLTEMNWIDILKYE